VHYLHDAELKAMDVWTYGRMVAALMLAPGTPAVQLAVDGPAPLFPTSQAAFPGVHYNKWARLPHGCHRGGGGLV
jgi:hypothetical protein